MRAIFVGLALVSCQRTTPTEPTSVSEPLSAPAPAPAPTPTPVTKPKPKEIPITEFFNQAQKPGGSALAAPRNPMATELPSKTSAPLFEEKPQRDPAEVDAERHAQADDFMARGKWLQAIWKYDLLVKKGAAYPRFDHALASMAACMRELAMCEDLAVLHRKNPHPTVLAELNRCKAALEKQ